MGFLLGKYFSENRSPVPYDSISPVFFQALISTEDERFYQHHGIDYQGLFAAVKDALHGKARGASTISQQLVKNMFRVRTKYSTGLLGKIPGVGILVMKSKEMIMLRKSKWCATSRRFWKCMPTRWTSGRTRLALKLRLKRISTQPPNS